MEEIIQLVQAGKLMEAETKLFSVMDEKRDELLESGRQKLREGVLQIHESDDEDDGDDDKEDDDKGED